MAVDATGSRSLLSAGGRRRVVHEAQLDEVGLGGGPDVLDAVELGAVVLQVFGLAEVIVRLHRSPQSVSRPGVRKVGRTAWLRAKVRLAHPSYAHNLMLGEDP